MNKTRLEKMLKMTQEELKSFLRKELRQLNREVYCEKGFLYSPGSFPVLMCSHLDIVYHKPTTEIAQCFEEGKEYWCSPTGIAGDDRCGIEIILELIESGKDVGVAFLEDEEMGGLGAYVFSDFFETEVENYNYVIEVDRKGNNEAVFYNCSNQEFIRFIINDYFNFDVGSFSDISFFAENNNIAAVNLSAGYYNEHMGLDERIYIRDMEILISEINKLLEHSDLNKKFRFAQYN